MTWAGPLWKGKTRKQIKAKKDRAEGKVKKSVRYQCVLRDGYCRLSKDVLAHVCDGPSEWAHLPGHTRAQTRGRPAEERHDRKWSLMLCKIAHDRLDNRCRPRLYVSTGPEGADGVLTWER